MMEQWMVALIDSDAALKVNGLLGFVWLGLFLCVTTFPGRGGTSAGAR